MTNSIKKCANFIQTVRSDGYKNALFELISSIDPERVGGRKHGHLNHLYGYRITKSYRLLYYVDRGKGEIVIVDLDDHKNVYGRD